MPSTRFRNGAISEVAITGIISFANAFSASLREALSSSFNTRLFTVTLGVKARQGLNVTHSGMEITWPFSAMAVSVLNGVRNEGRNGSSRPRATFRKKSLRHNILGTG
jgi:hypothetical protein